MLAKQADIEIQCGKPCPVQQADAKRAAANDAKQIAFFEFVGIDELVGRRRPTLWNIVAEGLGEGSFQRVGQIEHAIVANGIVPACLGTFTEVQGGRIAAMDDTQPSAAGRHSDNAQLVVSAGGRRCNHRATWRPN